MKRSLLARLLEIAALTLLGACSAPEQEPVVVTGTESGLTAVVSDPTIKATAEDDILILWEGKPLGEGVRGEPCGRLEIRADAKASLPVPITRW